ncbi:MAG TPA: SUMF1/EgtB/PvdO family nonheme iron enzyme, partial [Levilinea sp.]|nr:SUMF1/EgtB/PvdO family nonheme iron enzyme [Levilinea sp.]
ERADAADVLDQFWQPDDLYAYIPIDSPQGSFCIAKYPVTNAQYARFLDRKNFENRDLWCNFPQYSEPGRDGQVSPLDSTSEQGWEWLQKELEDKDNQVEDGVLYPRYWRDARFGVTRPSAPVVGVSWWEANAYCRWLCDHWDELEEGCQERPRPKLLRLPVEPEWELAAGGLEPKGRYAWDQGKVTTELDKILQRANIHESQIQRTTPVWMYPQGASPAGVIDLSGNVWEWQANYDDKGRDWLGLRGGSWDFNPDYARVANRDYNFPNDGYDSVGFRVVSPPV